jgi:hypothetical protein
MANNKILRISRRPFLAGLGSAMAVLLRPLVAEAEGAVPQRFLYIHYPCGTVAGFGSEGAGAKWFWFPMGAGGPGYTPSPLLNLFSAVKDSILPFDGLHIGDPDQKIDGDKHAQAMMYMGSGWISVAQDNAPAEGDPPNAKYITLVKGSKTIDQYLLDKVPALTAALIPGGAKPQFPSIQLCGTAKSMQNQGFTCLKVLSYAGNGQPLFGEGRSQNAFNNIFASAMMPGVDPLVFQRQQAQKKSVLDFVQSDIQRLQGMVPGGQRPKLDAQLTSIRALEARISAIAPGQIVKPVLASEPTAGHNGANADEARHQVLIQNMLEIIRTAFVSDLTRVASITFADGNNPLRPLTFVPSPGFTNNSDGHGLSHAGKAGDPIQGKGEVAAMYTGAVATLLANMQKTPEGSGNLLDNTLGMYFTECRDGDTHERRRNPCMLFGGKFLKLNTGQYMVVNPARYVNDIWASTLTAWGVPTTVYGDPQYAKGVIPGLYGV